MNLQDVSVKALSALVAALASAGFVGAVGGAILWARFHAAELPADQAVAAVPQRELVVVGAVALVSFVLAGVGALVAVYALDHCGTPGPRTRRGLLALMVAEILVAVSLGGFGVAAAVLLVAGVVTAGVMLAYLVEDAAGFLRARPQAERRLTVLLAWARNQLFGDVRRRERVRRVVGLALGLAGLAVVARADHWPWVALWLGVTLLVVALPLVPGWTAGEASGGRLRRMLAVAVIVYGLTALLRFEGSLASVTLAALALAALNLAVARATGQRFAFYGVSVFLSVILFGGFLSYVRTRDNPKLQAVAVLMKGGRSACGLYVTETDSRLLLARVDVVSGGRKGRVLERSGRLFWLPRDQIERSELGPLQGVTDAQEHAAELRDELLAEQRLGSAGAATTEPRSPAGGAVADVGEANECSPRPPPSPLRDTPQRDIAKRFQPRVVVDRDDGFWPTSVLAVFKLRHGERRTCRQVSDQECVRVARASQLPWIGGTGEWLEYPGANTDPEKQHEDMVRALGSRDPARTAREYFFVTGGDGQPTSVQYWFFYQFNYQRLGLGGVPIARAGFHEGDFETLGMLLSRDSKRPVYVWMARHSRIEGRPFVWSESQLRRSGEHLTVYSARGSHATYESCTEQRRRQLPRGLINDRPQCDPRRQLVLEPQVTPLSDLAFASWGCWQGKFGHSRRARRIPHAADVFADGPVSPLWQQGFNRSFRPCERTQGAPARSGAGEEVLDDATAATLRAHGGRLDGLFDSCAAWKKPPASGIYVVACNEQALDAFFGSGLEDMGDAAIAIRGPDGRAEAPGVPAVYRRPEAVDLDGVALTAQRATTADVYAVCYSGEHQVIREFKQVALTPGQARVLRTGNRGWTLTGGPGGSAPTLRSAAGRTRCERDRR